MTNDRYILNMPIYDDPNARGDRSEYPMPAVINSDGCTDNLHPYIHIGKPYTVSGNDNYDAWNGRGDLVVIPMESEFHGGFELCFGFHKGNTYPFIRLKPANILQEEFDEWVIHTEKVAEVQS